MTKQRWPSPTVGLSPAATGAIPTGMFFDQYGVAFLIAIISGALAFVINSSWPVHDCGNRYCRHVVREDELEQDI